MENKNSMLTLQETELDKDITFEVSKDVKVTTRLTFRKDDVIEQLVNRIRKLENEVKRFSKDNLIISEDALTKLWDNEDDRRWNNV